MICSLLPRHSQDLGQSVRESPLSFHPYVGLSQEGQQNLCPLPLSLRGQRLFAELQWWQRLYFFPDASLSDQCGQVPHEGLPAGEVLRKTGQRGRRRHKPSILGDVKVSQAQFCGHVFSSRVTTPS